MYYCVLYQRVVTSLDGTVDKVEFDIYGPFTMQAFAEQKVEELRQTANPTKTSISVHPLLMNIISHR